MADYIMFHSDMQSTDHWLKFSTDDLGKYLWNFAEELLHVWDADQCGSATLEVIVRGQNNLEKCFLFTNEYWIEHDPEWQIHNELQYERIEKVSFPYPSADRDWLTLAEFYTDYDKEQEPLGKIFEQVLTDNLWDLYCKENTNE